MSRLRRRIHAYAVVITHKHGVMILLAMIFILGVGLHYIH